MPGMGFLYKVSTCCFFVSVQVRFHAYTELFLEAVETSFTFLRSTAAVQGVWRLAFLIGIVSLAALLRDCLAPLKGLSGCFCLSFICVLFPLAFALKAGGGTLCVKTWHVLGLVYGMCILLLGTYQNFVDIRATVWGLGNGNSMVHAPAPATPYAPRVPAMLQLFGVDAAGATSANLRTHGSGQHVPKEVMSDPLHFDGSAREISRHLPSVGKVANLSVDDDDDLGSTPENGTHPALWRFQRMAGLEGGGVQRNGSGLIHLQPEVGLDLKLKHQPGAEGGAPQDLSPTFRHRPGTEEGAHGDSTGSVLEAAASASRRPKFQQRPGSEAGGRQKGAEAHQLDHGGPGQESTALELCSTPGFQNASAAHAHAATDTSCDKDTFGNLVGCRSSECSCAWFQQCFPKVIQSVDIGTCSTSMGMLVLSSLVIIFCVTLMLFCIRFWVIRLTQDHREAKRARRAVMQRGVFTPPSMSPARARNKFGCGASPPWTPVQRTPAAHDAG